MGVFEYCVTFTNVTAFKILKPTKLKQELPIWFALAVTIEKAMQSPFSGQWEEMDLSEQIRLQIILTLANVLRLTCTVVLSVRLV